MQGGVENCAGYDMLGKFLRPDGTAAWARVGRVTGNFTWGEGRRLKSAHRDLQFENIRQSF